MTWRLQPLGHILVGTNNSHYSLIPPSTISKQDPLTNHSHSHTTHTQLIKILHQYKPIVCLCFCVCLCDSIQILLIFIRETIMASTACFLHQYAALSSPAAARTASSNRYAPSLKPSVLICKAHKQAEAQESDGGAAVMSRRLALTVLIGAAAVGTKVSPADAAYGESANIFGKPKTNTDFKAYAGEGFKLSVPSKWNPSNEVEFPGQVLRYEDNFDATSNLSVMIQPTDKKNITDYGSPEDFLSKVDYLLGKQAYFGKTDSEGGFDSGAVATANILETATPVVDGAQYYFLSVLTRTADGDEGGKHQLISATVKDGKLYICKAQAGDKRWFKGARKFVESAATSFSVA